MERCFTHRLARSLTGSLLMICFYTPGAPLHAEPDGPSPGPSNASAAATGSWGDVNEDGLITAADAALLQTYILNKGSLTLAQAERIIRYGDVAGTVNRSEIGNGVVDRHDAIRSVLLTSGIIDAGTAGPVAASYGDVDSDNHVTIVDAVIVNRRRSGILPDASTLARVDAPGRGDISPTIPFLSFGDGRITSEDVALVQQRADGAEPSPPAYLDYWPLHAPTEAYPDTLPDLYTFTDVNGFTGDSLHRISFVTQSPKEVDGYTVTDVVGTDGSLVGVFKGIDGSIYAKYIKHPQTFGDNLIEFATPIKLLDIEATKGAVSEWRGTTRGYAAPLGVRPVVYSGAIIDKGPRYVPSAGDFPSGEPPSRWSSTISLRLDVGLLPGPQSQLEMQQAFFFDFTPGIGIIGRGQASLMGSPAPTGDRVRLEQTSARVRGRSYSLRTPAP